MIDSDYLKRPDAQGHLKVLEVLRKWDPIGVISEENVDEYDSYAPALIRMLDDEMSKDEILKWMTYLVTEHMGLWSFDRKGAAVYVDELIAFWREWKNIPNR